MNGALYTNSRYVYAIQLLNLLRQGPWSRVFERKMRKNVASLSFSKYVGRRVFFSLDINT